MSKKEKLNAIMIKEEPKVSPQVKKMKQGMPYSCKEKVIILNVFKYFRLEYPEKCVTEVVRRTARATGCSEKSVFQFRKEEASVEGFKQPSKTKTRKAVNINSRDIKYDNIVRQLIRNIIYDLKYKNIMPSLSTILKKVNEHEELPNFSPMTLRRLLFDMGFYYEKTGNKSVLMEKSDNKDNLPQSNKIEAKSDIDTVVQAPPPPPTVHQHHMQPSNNQYGSQYLPPMHLGHNDGYMMHSNHNRGTMFNSMGQQWMYPPVPHKE